MFTGYLSVTRALALVAIAAAIVLFLNTWAVAISYPFCDDMEDTTTGNWLFDSPWGYDAHYANSGTLSISDSPGGNYYENNINISATLSSMDFTTAEMPVLTFWHRCALETNADYGYIDVSTNGGSSWNKVYFVYGFDTEWREERVDLSEYALHSDVRIRFRLQSNAQNRYDGWYIDDVCIQETANPVIAYPFFDDMEDTAVTDANWLSSSWGLVGDAHSGVCSWHDSPEGNTAQNVHTSLTLAGSIDLAGAINPQLTFWHHRHINGSGYVEVSEDYGHSWTSHANFGGTQASWTQSQVDLSDYVGLEIRVRFRLRQNYGGYDGWYIDDVRISEASETMVDWCNLDSPDSISTSVGIETESIFGLVYESGITDDPGHGSGIEAQLGYGPDGTLPSTGSWTWVEASYHSDADSMDRYAATLILPYGGTFDYAYRYRLAAEQVWCYGDLDGNDLGIEGFNGYSTSQAGYLEVAGEAGIYVLPAEFDIPLNVGEFVEDTLIIRNDGTGALSFEILEAIGGGLLAEAAPSIGDINASALLKPFSVQTEDLPPNQKSSLSGRKTRLDNPSSQLTMVDVPWVTENPISGTVPPDDSAVVVVTFDASELEGGAYDAYMVIVNNDPDSDMVVVELHLSVNPPGPFSLLSPPDGDSLAVPGILCWQEATDPDADDTVRYDIWLSTDVGFRDSVVKVEGVTDSSVLLEDVTAYTMWYWKVLAYDQSSAERWSNESWNFYTGTRGDINGDGEIKPEDIICLLNYLFRNGPPPVPLQAGDCNCDGMVSPPDVICLINYLFRNGPPPSC